MRQIEYFLLDVRCEVQQVHDLRHAGLGDVGEAGQLGHVSDLAGAEQVVEADRHVFWANSVTTGSSDPLSRYIRKISRTRAASLALTTSFGLPPERSTS